MNYTVQRLNDNNTATVMMDFTGKEVVQDFDMGATPDELIANIEQGMAVIQHELEANVPTDAPTLSGYEVLVNKTEQVDKLPVLDAADFAVPVEVPVDTVQADTPTVA